MVKQCGNWLSIRLLNFDTKFLDTAEVRLSVNQSYFDSVLGGHLKIMISGVRSNTGIRLDKKQERKFQKDLKKRDVLNSQYSGRFLKSKLVND